ncbi:lasso peptide biosynthesis B2 protein [Novosphingobium kaempferiae]|uniref:lasso peptide biosynthesis B2 protein n=1 Tax=Novosphingobium kaempferiae TaxID=2896849 RepID=UPI001E5271FE|nr:lasso peptide biosynthesis B2 protein [Novosphingobium kaempferiae]
MHFCIAGERVILLDPGGGRYRALTHEQAPAFRRWALGAALIGLDHERLLELKDRDVLAVSDQDQPPMAMTSARIALADTALDPASGNVSSWLVFAALTTQLVWSRRVKTWPLERLLAVLKGLGSNAGQVLPRTRLADRDAIVRAFARADMLLGSNNRCLARSLALAASCRKHGLASTLVIGIQPNPFAAHCWVQDEGLVLNDRPDRVQMFAPILTVC